MEIQKAELATPPLAKKGLGPKQIAWIEDRIPNVKHCAAAVAARDASVRKAEKMANG